MTNNNIASELKEALLSREDAVIESFLNEPISKNDTEVSIGAKIDTALAGYTVSEMQGALESLDKIATKQELEDEPELN